MTEEKNKFQALDHGLGSVIRDPPIYKKTSQNTQTFLRKYRPSDFPRFPMGSRPDLPFSGHIYVQELFESQQPRGYRICFRPHPTPRPQY